MTGLELFAYMVVMSLLSYALTMGMTPKVQKPTAGSLDIPTITIGKKIPVIFGTNVIKDVSIVWYGDARVQEIKMRPASAKK